MTVHSRPEQLAATAIDFGLTPAEQAEVDVHVATCAGCRALANAYRSDASGLRQIAFAEPPARVHSAILVAAASPAARSIRPSKLLVAVTLLAALLGAAFAIGALNERPTLVVTLPFASPSANGTAEPTVATPSTPAASLSTTPPLADVKVPLRWARVADQPSFADAGMTAVVAGPDGYVAVGCATTAQTTDINDCSGASWTSTDGLTWLRGTVPAAEGLYLMGVAVAPIGYLAWAFEPGVGAAFWTSPEGATWRRAPTIPSFAFMIPDGAVWFRDRFIAFGSNEGSSFWSSPDGLSWSDLPFPAACGSQGTPGDPAAAPGIGGLVVFGDELLAWGVNWPTDAQATRDTIARTIDGACWTRSDAPAHGKVTGMVATERGVVGIGYVPPAAGQEQAGVPNPGAAWTSSDGFSWADATFVPRAPSAHLEQIAFGDRGAVAVGGDGVGPRMIYWRSADGASWTADPSAPPGYLMSVVATPDGFLAVGRDEMAGVRATVWIAR